MDLGEAGGVLEFAVDLVFVAELGTTRAVLFEFDGHLFPVGADAEVDVTERAAADSFRDAVFGDGGLHFLWVRGEARTIGLNGAVEVITSAVIRILVASRTKSLLPV